MCVVCVGGVGSHGRLVPNSPHCSRAAPMGRCIKKRLVSAGPRHWGGVGRGPAALPHMHFAQSLRVTPTGRCHSVPIAEPLPLPRPPPPQLHPVRTWLHCSAPRSARPPAPPPAAPAGRPRQQALALSALQRLPRCPELPPPPPPPPPQARPTSPPSSCITWLYVVLGGLGRQRWWWWVGVVHCSCLDDGATQQIAIGRMHAGAAQPERLALVSVTTPSSNHCQSRGAVVSRTVTNLHSGCTRAGAATPPTLPRKQRACRGPWG